MSRAASTSAGVPRTAREAVAIAGPVMLENAPWSAGTEMRERSSASACVSVVGLMPTSLPISMSCDSLEVAFAVLTTCGCLKLGRARKNPLDRRAIERDLASAAEKGPSA